MPKRTGLKVALGVVGSFACLAAAIVFLSAAQIVTFAVAKLMLAALLGMYVGFGFLIVVYVVVRKWE